MSTTNIFRKSASLAVALLLIGSVSFIGVKRYDASHAATGGSMSLSPGTASIAAGQMLSITVNEDGSSYPVAGVTFTMTYDASKLQYKGVAEGSVFTQQLETTPSPGQLVVSRGIPLTSTASGGIKPVVTVNFMVQAGSGSTTVSLGSPSDSYQVADGQPITQNVGTGTYTYASAATPPPPSATITKDATLSLSPSTKTVKTGDTLNVAVKMTSPTQPVRTVEPVVTFDPSKLEYIDTTDSSDFPLNFNTKTSSGSIDLVRAKSTGVAGMTGTGVVATLNFKVVGNSGTTAVSLSTSSVVYNSNSDNIILNRNPASYAINSNTPPPPPPPVVTPTTPNPGPTPTPPAPAPTPSPTGTTTSSSKTPVYTKSATFTPSASTTGSASINNDSTQVSGAVDIQPVVDPSILASNPSDSIVKVEYYLGKTLVATKNTPPYTYTFDTKKLKNGTYDMTIKTYYSSGTVDPTKSKLVVKNPVTLSYVLAHYATDLLALFIGLVIVALILWKFIWPRFRGGDDGGLGGGMYATDTAGYSPAGYGPEQNTYEAPDPTVVVPSGGQQDTSGVITPGQQAAAQETPALGGSPDQGETAFNPGSYGLPNEGQAQPQPPVSGTPPPPTDQQGTAGPGDRRIY